MWLERDFDYEIEIEPIERGVPRGIFSLGLDDQKDSKRRFELSAPMAFFGTVLGEDLEGRADVEVEVIERAKETNRVVARTRSDADGSFQLVLPSRPPLIPSTP